MKDTITNICGLVVAVGGGVLSAAVSGTIVLPAIVTTILGIAVTIATGVIGYFTGKTPAK